MIGSGKVQRSADPSQTPQITPDREGGAPAQSFPGIGILKDPGSLRALGPSQVLSLQRTIGNQAVAQIARPVAVQRHEPSEVVAERNTIATTLKTKPEDLVALLVTSVGSVEALGSAVWAEVDEATILEEYAKDKAARTGETGESAKAAAKQEFKDNKGRGFASLDGKIWMLSGVYAKSDLLHEFIHILSGSGGATKILSDIGSSFNEGMTQYFAEQICAATGGSVKPAYPEETVFMGKLAAGMGLPAMYDAYFKGNVDGFLTKMLAQYKTYVDSGKGKDGKNLPFSEKVTQDKPWDAGARKALILTKLKDFKTGASATWVLNRVIP